MKNYIKSLICKFKGHELKDAGHCPYTGLSYRVCLKCTSILPKEGQ